MLILHQYDILAWERKKIWNIEMCMDPTILLLHVTQKTNKMVWKNRFSHNMSLICWIQVLWIATKSFIQLNL